VAGAALLFGGGVWSLHFIAMLADRPWAFSAYPPFIALFCAAIAILGALVAMANWLALPPGRGGVALSGATLGLSIAGAHYGSLLGFDSGAFTGLDRNRVLLSISYAVVLATISMARARRLDTRPRRLEAALWLTATVLGLHLIGMSAMRMRTGPMQAGPLQAGPAPAMQAALSADPGLATFAAAVGVLSLVLLLLSLAATLVERHLSQRAVMELARLRRLSEISHESVIIHRHGIVLQANGAGGRLFGVPPAQLVGKALSDLIAESERGILAETAVAPPGQGSGQGPDQGPGEKPGQILIERFDGRLVPVAFTCNPLDYDGEPAFAVILADLTDRKRDEARIRHFADHDALTGLPNRIALRTRIARTLEAGPGRAVVALFAIDLDRFKAVNEAFGHVTGDQLLRQAGARLGAPLRPGDMLARIDGDGFAALVHAADLHEIRLLAARMIDALKRPFSLDGKTVEIGGSIGIALFPADARSATCLVDAAHRALQHAKRDRGDFCFFEPEMDAQRRTQRWLEQDLRHALDRGELRLHYQPQVDCRTAAIVGYEALLRWQHPVHGAIEPAAFIPLAEESGLIRRIGAWAMETACLAAAQWPAGLPVAVNISPVQFRQHDIGAVIATALSRSGLPASRLEIEITESVLLHEPETVFRTLTELRAVGIRIALDDFGTGYSSLSYLTSFRFDRIKIDRSFVAKLGCDDAAQASVAAIVGAIVGLAHTLGSAVTAEGIETEAQLRHVTRAGCDSIQGYLIGHPLDTVPAAPGGGASGCAGGGSVAALLADARLVKAASF
jgi:diguanylate cyclase (GGDEF)-like protein/PAS domain S-box-containing protein